MKSLQANLLVGMIGSFAALLAVFGLVLDGAIEYGFVREFDFYLETVARTLAASAEVQDARIDVKLVPEALPDIQQVEGELFSQYWKGDGTPLAKSKNLANHNLPCFSGEAGQPMVRAIVLPDGRRARAAGLRFPLRRPERTARGAGRQSLRPLHRVAATIAAIKEGDLSARVPATTMPEEIVPLVERLNELLHRLDEAFARERCLTADIAHELRTPVAGILSTAGVTLSADREPPEYREALEDVREIARRMRSMIENLLALARLDSQSAQFQFEPIVLRELIELSWQGCRERAAARSLAFENQVSDDLSFTSDKNALSIVLINLLENAVEYADEGGRIWIAARKADSFVEIEVANTGCRLADISNPTMRRPRQS